MSDQLSILGASPDGKRYRCRRSYCPNRYDDVVGADGWGKKKSGAECLPCLYAMQMVSHGQTPEQIEAAPEMVEQFNSTLYKMGWSWRDIKDSYERIQRLPQEQREYELIM